MIGKTIAGRYQIELELGSGGMGRVYRAVDAQTHATVAVKHLLPELARRDLIERFKREGEVLRELNHPNMVKLLDTIEDESGYFLVMDYVSGGDLRQLIEQGQLSIEQILQLAIDLADALTRAHRLGIIHRDLKPANVLIARDSTPRLSDFGVAFVSDKERVTGTNAIVGTIEYLAPEAFQSEPIDNKADIWAFGVMLFEMLTGEKPFKGDSVSQTIYAILSDEIPNIEELRPDAPIALVDLIYRMLEKDQHQRIPSVRNVGADLEAILQGRDMGKVSDSRFGTPVELLMRPKHNLPMQATAFIGREAELAELAKLLNDPKLRLVTIVAPGGMGKTRLSLEAAERQLDNFKDGVYFVELAPIGDSSKIAVAIATALGYEMQDNEISEKQQLFDFLSHKHLLLIMDNFEHLIDAASLVSEILNAAPKLMILASSRQRLKQTHETIFNLQGMEFPTWETPEDALEYAAVKLFLQSARRVQSQFELTKDNMDAVARICKLVQGMPLGILLAASWLSMLSPEEIAAEVKQSIDFLESDLSDLPDRQQSIRVVFDYSWQMMSPDEQEVFRKLCIFRDGFTRDAAQTIIGANLRTLMNLMNKSLLQRNVDTGRYNIHELLRQYAYEKLEETGELETLQEAHSDYYLRFMQERQADIWGRRQIEAIDEIEADFENFRAAWLRALDNMNYEGIGASVEVLCCFLWMRSRWRLDSYLVTQAQERFAQHTNEEMDFVWAMLLTRNVPNHDDPLAVMETALKIMQERGDKEEIGLNLLLAGNIYGNRGDHLEALRYVEGSIPYFEAVGDQYHLAQASFMMAWSSFWLGDYETSMEYSERGLEIRRTIGDIDGLSASIYEVADRYFVIGNLAESELHRRESLVVAKQVRRFFTIGYIGYVLGVYHDFGIHGNLEQARWQVEDSLKNLKEDNVFGFASQDKLVQSLFAAIEENYDEARRSGTEAFRLAQDNNEGWYPIFAWGLVMAASAQEDYDTVREHTYNSFQYFWDLRVIPVLLMYITFAAILEAYQKKNARRATEFLALTSTHPKSMSGWLELWPLIDHLKAYLENELGTEAYQAAWERGKNLEWETVVSGLISEYGREDTNNESAIPAHILEANARLLEPLSERELEVLLKIAAGYSNAEIAEQLFVGVSTVKKHITHIYGKLEVDSRTKALLKAQDLGLI